MPVRVDVPAVRPPASSHPEILLPRPLPVALEARVLPERRAPILFEVHAGDGSFRLRGGLSAGQSGWRLTASARQHRRRITLRIIATRDAEQGSREAIEEYEYAATVAGLVRGRYEVAVQHLFVVPFSTRGGLELNAYECQVVVD